MEIIGKGRTATVYDYKEGKLVKLFEPFIPKSAIERECNNALVINSLGVNSPKCFGLVHIDGKDGICYQYLEGITLLQHLEAINDFSFFLESFVEIQQKINASTCNNLNSYKEFLKMHVTSKNLLKRIDDLPDSDHVCHGDYHPGNLIVNGEQEVFVIDFMNVCKGPKEYDIARTYFLTVLEKVPNPELQKAQEALGEAYLNASGVTLEQIQPYLDVIKSTREIELKN